MTPPTPSETLLQAIHHYNEGDMVQAGQLAQTLFNQNPEQAEVVHLLGMVASRTGRLDLAARLLMAAVDLQPQQPHYRLHLGELYGKQGNDEAAEGQYRQAIRLKPDFVHAHVNLGNLCFSRGERAQAMAAYQTATQLDPKTHIAWYNMGIIAQEESDHERALHCFEQALRAAPEVALTHTARAFSLLATGRFLEGWQEYEWRWQLPDNLPRRTAQPRWEGSDPRGKRLYLCTEQGFGDALLFVRYLKQLRAQGAHLILECKPELLNLFQTSQLADQMVARADDDQTPPAFVFDYHLPLLSLPAIPGMFAAPHPTLPESVPYLTADPDLCAQWQNRLRHLPGLRVALCWSGNPETGVNRYRAAPFAAFLPLVQMEGISFVSIQKGRPTQELHQHPEGAQVWDLSAHLTDFAQTAALLTQVDLLISTDTAVVHLAGALGRPVWTLLHTAAEWRWLQHRSDSPWYPSMQLFRQQVPGDWVGVILSVEEALRLRKKQKNHRLEHSHG
ncbi:MAG: glycosyltransferase family protein [Magnetococcales bacterium]|nr:glycosyltransferase family protein [Magnetococcales bacterium]